MVDVHILVLRSEGVRHWALASSLLVVLSLQWLGDSVAVVKCA